MRKSLKQFNKEKVFATATFVRYGHSYSKTKTSKRLDDKSYKLLFRDITIKGNEDVLVGHMWFGHSKAFKSLGLLEKGDTIEIYGEIQKYTKKNDGKQTEDYEIVPLRINRI